LSQQPDLWTIRITCDPASCERIEALWEDQALAVSVLAPPRKPTASVEVLVEGQPDENAVRARLAPVADELRDLTIESVGNLDWIKKVSGDFPPLPIARWTVFGAAHRDKIKDFSLALQIDATSAFGTGEHPTTRGCLLQLDALLTQQPALAHGRMLDMGCGSGILAMAYAKATQGYALGVDSDELSVEIANENVLINEVSARVSFIVGLGYAPPKVAQDAPFDLIMSNIFAQPLCEMAPDLNSHLKPGGWVILSGLLLEQEEAVRNAHLAQGLTLENVLHIGEWSILTLRRPIVSPLA